MARPMGHGFGTVAVLASQSRSVSLAASIWKPEVKTQRDVGHEGTPVCLQPGPTTRWCRHELSLWIIVDAAVKPATFGVQIAGKMANLAILHSVVPAHYAIFFH